MIVKDEEDVILRCLESVISIIDAAIIVDTGSSDNTIELIRDFFNKTTKPLMLENIKWQDFAHGRNMYIHFAEHNPHFIDIHDYLLVMDADQVLEVLPGFNKEELTADYYDCIVRYGSGFTHMFPKIFTLESEPRYKGRIHNYLSFRKNVLKEKLSTLIFNDYHDGKRSKDYVRKLKNDIVILKQEISMRIDIQRNTFYLAQSFYELKMYQDAINTYLKRINLGGYESEIYYSKLKIGISYMYLMFQKDDWFSGFGNCYQAFIDAYIYNPKRSEPLYYIGNIYRQLHQYKFAKFYLDLAKAIPFPKDDEFFISKDIYEYLIDFELGIVEYYLGNYQLSYDINEKLLLNPIIPKGYLEFIKQNIEFAKKALDNKLQIETSAWEMPVEIMELIELTVPYGSTILELGSGSGTKRLVENYTVHSIEHDSHFLNIYHQNYIHAPIVDKWYDANIIRKNIPKNYDVVLIDGPPSNNESDRLGFIDNMDLFDLSKMIILDDYNRQKEKNVKEKIEEKLILIGYNREGKTINTKSGRTVYYWPPFDSLTNFGLIFIDEKTTAFNENTFEKRATGSSSLMANNLLKHIAQKTSVLAITNETEVIENFDISDSSRYKIGIKWYPQSLFHKSKCTFYGYNVIYFRHTALSAKITYQNIFRWHVDLPTENYIKFVKKETNDRIKNIFLSDYQKLLYEMQSKDVSLNNIVIGFGLINEINKYKETKKKRNKFIYASSAVKGLESTLRAWGLMKKKAYPKLIDAKLYIYHPGYDEVKGIISKLKTPDVIYKGNLPINKFLLDIADASGLFYVNDLPETFGFTPYLALALNMRVHVLYTKEAGSLFNFGDHKAMFLDYDKETFINRFIESYGKKIIDDKYIFRTEENMFADFDRLL